MFYVWSGPFFALQHCVFIAPCTLGTPYGLLSVQFSLCLLKVCTVEIHRFDQTELTRVNCHRKVHGCSIVQVIFSRWIFSRLLPNPQLFGWNLWVFELNIFEVLFASKIMLFPVQDKLTILTMPNAHTTQRYLHFQLIFLKYVLSKLPNVYNSGSHFF